MLCSDAIACSSSFRFYKKHAWIWGGTCQRRQFALAAAKQLLAVGFFLFCGRLSQMMELEYIMMEWWWNDGMLFSFFPLRHMFFFASDLCILLMFIEVLHRVLEPHFSMLHTKAQALATKVAFWRRDLCLLCAGGLAARDRQEIAMVCYCYCYKMTYHD